MDGEQNRVLRVLLGQWGIAAGIVLGAAIIAGAIVIARDDDGASASRLGVQLPAGDTLRQRIHEHADFALYIRGERFDFGKPEFIATEDDEKNPNAHIHDPRHTVIHVHREATTWDEFFLSLGFELKDPTMLVEPGQESLKLPSGEVLRSNGTETLKFIVNGVRVDGIAGQNIGGLTRTLISYGDETGEELMAQYLTVTDEACIPSGVCIERGDGSGEHGEPCSTAGGQCN
ncbi:MAG: hypothetical protein M9925_10215 [Chloroflexi bacterium]|nr:hypothetical protein [Chloroflexota bacterium]MCZ7577431.1 hypothetical protein [Dehalococcoidia bacterium]NJD66925.1 hypothetical protein [Chloroflexota bacterium]